MTLLIEHEVKTIEMGLYCDNAVAEQVSVTQLTFSKIRDGGLKETKAPSLNLDFKSESYRSIVAIIHFCNPSQRVTFRGFRLFPLSPLKFGSQLMD